MPRASLLLRLLVIAVALGGYGGSDPSGSAPPIPRVNEWHEASCLDVSVGILRPQATRLGLPNKGCQTGTGTVNGIRLFSERVTSEQFGFRLDFTRSRSEPGAWMLGDDATNRKVFLVLVDEWATVVNRQMPSYVTWQGLENLNGWRLQRFQINQDVTLKYQCVGFAKYADPVPLENGFRTRFIGFYCALSQFPLTPTDIALVLGGLKT
jgi:hypothetical protein